MSRIGVIAFGEIAIDHCLFVPKSFLSDRGLAVGGIIDYDENFHRELLENFKIEFSAFGGSSANVVKGLRMLGYRSGILSVCGDDELGERIMKEIHEFDLEDLVVTRGGCVSGECIGCVHPDSMRTMYGVFDPGLMIHPDEVCWDRVSSYEYVVFEGFQFGKTAYDEVIEVLEWQIRDNEQKVVFILSDMFWVPEYRGRVLEFLKGVSIITGNEHEFKQLFNKTNREELLEYMESLDFELVAITMGSDGAYLIHKHKRLFIPIEKRIKAVDTVGAGDYFSSGLLYGYVNGYSLDVCGRVGAMLAGDVVSRIGNNPGRGIVSRIHEYLRGKKRVC